MPAPAALRKYALAAWVAQVLGAPYTEENKEQNCNHKVEHEPENYYGKWDGHKPFDSPTDWREIPVYQLLTDRFADGNPENNEFPGYGGYDLRDHTMRHGGDFKGIMDNLDYIRGLGFRAIWISPVFQNGENGYHGYGQEDFTLIDKRWGTLEELRALVTAAHDRGMYVLVDIVVNHMASRFRFHDRTSKQAVDGTVEFRLHEDEYELHLTERTPYPYYDFSYNNEFDPTGLYPHPELEKRFPYYGHYGEAVEDNGTKGKGGFWKSDFHHNGDLISYVDALNCHLGKIYGLLDDLRTEAPSVRQKIIAMTRALIQSTDIDGIRMDTPMQVELDFFKTWIPAVRATAEGLGKKNFGFWGEFFCTPGKMGTMVGKGIAGTGPDPQSGDDSAWLDDRRAFDGGIDYMVGMWTQSVITLEMMDKSVSDDMAAYAGPGGIEKIWEYQRKRWDFFSPAMNKFAYQQWTFCNNHDRDRMQTAGSCGRQKLDMCSTILTFFPGQYVYYVGDEQEFRVPGTALNGWAREELATSLAWRGMTSKDNGDSFNMASDSYRRTARTNAVLKEYWPLLECDGLVVHQTPAQGHGGIVAFERSCPGTDKMLVVVNMDSKSNSVDFRAAEKLGWVADLNASRTIVMEVLSGYTSEVDSDGDVHFDLDGWGYGVYVLKKQARHLAPTVVKVTPDHDKVYAGGYQSIFFTDVMEIGSIQVFITDKADRRQQLQVEQQKPDEVPKEYYGRVFTFRGPENLQDGIYRLEVKQSAKSKLSGKTMASSFWSRFHKNVDADRSVLLPLSPSYQNITDNSLIQVNVDAEGNPVNAKLEHHAPGASKLRVRSVEGNTAGMWSGWEDYKDRTDYKNFKWGVPVIVQYWAQGSAAYFAAACKESVEKACFVSWYPKMHWYGEERVEWPANWVKYPMKLVADFVWEVAVPVYAKKSDEDRSPEYKYNPAGDDGWTGGSLGQDKPFKDGAGQMMGLPAVQRYQVEHKLWPGGTGDKSTVGKLQEQGVSLKWDQRCPPGEGDTPNYCLFRVHDVSMLFVECRKEDLLACYMPGEPIPAADFSGETCRLQVPVPKTQWGDHPLPTPAPETTPAPTPAPMAGAGIGPFTLVLILLTVVIVGGFVICIVMKVMAKEADRPRNQYSNSAGVERSVELRQELSE